MDETKTSLMMKFEQAGGAIEAECPLSVYAYDDLATKKVTVPIKNGTPVDVPGFRIGTQLPPKHFLITSFSFAAELSSGETSGATDGATSGATTRATTPPPAGRTGGAGGRLQASGALGHGQQMDPEQARRQAAKKAASSAMLALWRSATGDNWNKDGIYSGRIQDFSFTRLIDRATPTLFNACCLGTTFKSATLVKRKALQGMVKGQLATVDIAYLRMDFAGVKITSLDWSDGDVVEENCKFTCDGMLVTYARQDDSGKLWPSHAIGWSNPMSDNAQRA